MSIMKENEEIKKRRAENEKLIREAMGSASSDDEPMVVDQDEILEGKDTPLISAETKMLTADPNMSYEKFKTDPFGRV